MLKNSRRCDEMESQEINGGRVEISDVEIRGNGNRIRGHRNKIIGSGNHLYGDWLVVCGDGNYINGWYCKIYGNANHVIGGRNVVQGDANICKGYENEMVGEKNVNDIRQLISETRRVDAERNKPRHTDISKVKRVRFEPPPDYEDDVDVDMKCVVCLEHARRMINWECNHFVVCYSCSRMCKTCPTCRGPVKFEFVYL